MTRDVELVESYSIRYAGSSSDDVEQKIFDMPFSNKRLTQFVDVRGSAKIGSGMLLRSFVSLTDQLKVASREGLYWEEELRPTRQQLNSMNREESSSCSALIRISAIHLIDIIVVLIRIVLRVHGDPDPVHLYADMAEVLN
jgi:hypothetical protein